MFGQKREIFTEKAPKPIGPYSQAVKFNCFLFLSLQLPLDAQTGEVFGTSIEEQTQKVFENIEAILTEAGSDFERVLKVNVYLKDMNDFQKFNAIYQNYFNKPFPARSVIEVSKLPKDAKIAIDLIATVY